MRTHPASHGAFVVGFEYRVDMPANVAAPRGLIPGETVVLQEIDMTTRAETLFWVRSKTSRGAIPVMEDDLAHI